MVSYTYNRNMYLISHYDEIGDTFEIDWNSIDVSGVDTYTAAYSFCTDYLGLESSEVDRLIDKLTVSS